jgi:hypothetical protein
METRTNVRIVTLSSDEEVLVQAVIADTAAEATVLFGHNSDRAALTQKAVEVASELLGRPTRVLDFLPSLAVGEARRGLASR